MSMLPESPSTADDHHDADGLREDARRQDHPVVFSDMVAVGEASDKSCENNERSDDAEDQCRRGQSRRDVVEALIVAEKRHVEMDS